MPHLNGASTVVVLRQVDRIKSLVSNSELL